MYIMKILISLGIFFLISGCSQRREANPIIIETPPNRIAISGKITEDQERVIYTILDKLLEMPYEQHKFERPIGVDIKYNINDVEQYSTSRVVSVGNTVKE